MSKINTALLYLILILAIILIGAALTFIRADLGTFDPKLTFGLTAITLLSVMSSMGAVVGGNVIIGFLLKTPLKVVLWVPIGAGLALAAHHFLGGYLGLMGLDRVGIVDAFLMYLPSVGLLSLIGGLMGSVLARKGSVAAPAQMGG